MQTYSTTVDRTRLDYVLEGETLRCSVSGVAGFSLSVALNDPEIHLAKARRFSRWFWIGLTGVLGPIFTFTVICIRERTVDFGSTGSAAWFHLLFFVAGAVLVSVFGRPLPGYRVTVGKNQGIAVWSRRGDQLAFRAFITELQQRIASLRAGLLNVRNEAGS